MLLGGGPRPPEALARFVAWAGNGRSHILVITWASGEPEESFASLHDELALYRPAAVEAAPPPPLGPQERTVFLAALKRATGVFFGGGDQARILDVLKDSSLLDALHARYREGVVFGGTSAGTACMSSLAITGQGDFTVIDGARVEVRAGLGLLPGVILDQHFLKRQRQNRLFGLVLDHPQMLGVGVDEGTALAIRDNRHAEVMGSSQVMMVDARTRPGELLLRLVNPGQTFDLRKRRAGTRPARG